MLDGGGGNNFKYIFEITGETGIRTVYYGIYVYFLRYDNAIVVVIEQCPYACLSVKCCDATITFQLFSQNKCVNTD